MSDGFTVLLVEDDENDVTLLKRAFKKVGVRGEIHPVPNGEEAIAYLLGYLDYHDRDKFPYPNVIVTDLKMPQKTGFELLKWLRENPVYQVIPTIVLSSSRQPRDIKHAYYLGANCYFVKPATFEELVELVDLLQRFWTKAEIPS